MLNKSIIRAFGLLAIFGISFVLFYISLEAEEICTPKLVLSVEVGNKEGQCYLTYGSIIGGTKEDPLYVLLPTGSFAVDSKGYIYIGNRYLCKIQKFDKNGQYLFGFGGKGYGDGEFELIPGSICVDIEDNIYVIDGRQFLPGQRIEGYYNRIEKFDSNGNFLFSIEKKANDWLSGISTCLFLKNFKTLIFENQLYKMPGKPPIYKYDLQGKFLGEAKYANEDNDGAVYYSELVSDNTLVIKKEVRVKNTFQKDDSFSIEFSKESESGNAEILGFDRENNIYIITSNDCNVESNGEILQKIDERGRRVCLFDSKGGFLTAVQLQQKTKIGNAEVVRIDIHGNIYQMINNCRKITEYTPGDRVEIWKYEMRIE